jgi:putative NADH-flavin reductase
MNIAVFGGTGRVGRAFIKRCLQDNHSVKALARMPEKLEKHEHLTVIEGNVRNVDHVRETIKGCDLVFSALSTDKSDTLTVATPLVIDAMTNEGISRVVTIGTAGILNSRYEEGKYRFETDESKRSKTFAAEEHLRVFHTLQDSPLDWTIVCPTYLPDGPEMGHVRAEQNMLPDGGKKISVGDTAAFAYQELLSPSYLKARVGICY